MEISGWKVLLFWHEMMIAGEGGEVTDGDFIIVYMTCNSCKMIILLAIRAYFKFRDSSTVPVSNLAYWNFRD